MTAETEDVEGVMEDMEIVALGAEDDKTVDEGVDETSEDLIDELMLELNTLVSIASVLGMSEGVLVMLDASDTDLVEIVEKDGLRVSLLDDVCVATSDSVKVVTSTETGAVAVNEGIKVRVNVGLIACLFFRAFLIGSGGKCSIIYQPMIE